MKLKLSFIICVSVLILYGCKDTTIAPDTENIISGKVKSRASGERTFVFPPIQWESFETHDQKLAACQIPDSVLSQIPTKELVEVCMEYPLLFDAFAFDTPLKGLKIVASRFNGFQELMKRSDNCLCIFNYLKNKDIREVDFTGLSLEEEGRITLLYMLCEYLLSFDNILANMTSGMESEIAQYAYNVWENKENRNQHFAWGDIVSASYLCVKALSVNSVQSRSVNSELDDFVATGMFQNIEQYRKIKQYCQNIIQH